MRYDVAERKGVGSNEILVLLSGHAWVPKPAVTACDFLQDFFAMQNLTWLAAKNAIEILYI
jgi:hypothetical protein